MPHLGEVRYMKLLVLMLAVAVAMTFSSFSLAGAKTTAPSKKVLIFVLINDDGIYLGKYGMIINNKFAEDLVPLTTAVPRGDYVSFQVLNRGKNVHDFTILGKRTPRLKPGGKAHLFLTALTRGNFLYRSTLDKGKSFRGYLSVA
jgi:hypothetical protein